VRATQYPPTEAGVIVAYSGGKDSLAVLDLAVQHFRRVEAFYMAFIPGLDYSKAVTDYARTRFGVPVHEYIHHELTGYLEEGAFCDQVEVRRLGMIDVINTCRNQTGLVWCGVGYRVQESLLQRRWLSKTAWRNGAGVADALNRQRLLWAPIRDWTTKELIAYLRRRHIVVPGMSADKSLRPSGIGPSARSLDYLRRCWPADYERMLAIFPWAVDQSARLEHYERQRKAIAQRRREYDAQRGSAASRGYGYAWQKLRQQVLTEEPCCRLCLANGVRVATTDVDHIIPRREFLEARVEGDPDRRENLQGLCASCHSRKTARDDSYFAGGRLEAA